MRWAGSVLEGLTKRLQIETRLSFFVDQAVFSIG